MYRSYDNWMGWLEDAKIKWTSVRLRNGGIYVEILMIKNFY